MDFSEMYLQSKGIITMDMIANGERCCSFNEETGELMVTIGNIKFLVDDNPKHEPTDSQLLMMQIVEMEMLIDNLSHNPSLIKTLKTPEQLQKEKLRQQQGPIILKFDKDWWLTHDRPKK